MATPLRVPRQYEGGFAKIRDLPDESVRDLLEALEQIPNTYNDSELSSAVAAKVDTIAATDVEEIVYALLSVYAHFDYSQDKVSDIVKGIAQAMEEGESERLRISSEDRPRFEDRLTKLLSIDPLRVTVRAGRLSVEGEHSLQDVRVLTDIRPVFEPEDPEADPRGAIIVHTLKLSYWGDNRINHFFVTLDPSDLRKLLNHLERAGSKAETLKSILRSTQLPYIDAE
jgi:hypothetical protein